MWQRWLGSKHDASVQHQAILRSYQLHPPLFEEPVGPALQEKLLWRNTGYFQLSSMRICSLTLNVQALRIFYFVVESLCINILWWTQKVRLFSCCRANGNRNTSQSFPATYTSQSYQSDLRCDCLAHLLGVPEIHSYRPRRHSCPADCHTTRANHLEPSKMFDTSTINVSIDPSPGDVTRCLWLLLTKPDSP